MSLFTSTNVRTTVHTERVVQLYYQNDTVKETSPLLVRGVEQSKVKVPKDPYIRTGRGVRRSLVHHFRFLDPV